MPAATRLTDHDAQTGTNLGENRWDVAEARSLGNAIRRFRRAKGLSQEELAQASGITRNHLSLLEAGQPSSRRNDAPANPRVSTLVAIAAALEVPVLELVPGFAQP